MPLDPQARVIIDLIESLGFGSLGANTDPVAMRELMNAAAIPSSTEVARVEDREIPGPDRFLRIRVYRPAGDQPKPVIVYYHGGGWVLGSLESHDGVCRDLAVDVDAIVVAVDYRLAPEDRFPAAVDDAYAAARWVHANARALGGDPDRIAVAGDSAGGNLAAIVAQQARGTDLAVRFQLLVYPVTDYEFLSVSMEENAVGYYLTRDSMRWFYDQYLTRPAEGEDPRVSPLRAKDLSGLPPAFVVTAQYDPLRDQGCSYADALRACGNQVESVIYDGMFHGFFSMSEQIDAAKVAFGDAVAALRAGLAVT